MRSHMVKTHVVASPRSCATSACALLALLLLYQTAEANQSNCSTSHATLVSKAWPPNVVTGSGHELVSSAGICHSSSEATQTCQSPSDEYQSADKPLLQQLYLQDFASLTEPGQFQDHGLLDREEISFS